jgi:hypothetical protein
VLVGAQCGKSFVPEECCVGRYNETLFSGCFNLKDFSLYILDVVVVAVVVVVSTCGWIQFPNR